MTENVQQEGRTQSPAAECVHGRWKLKWQSVWAKKFGIENVVNWDIAGFKYILNAVCFCNAYVILSFLCSSLFLVPDKPQVTLLWFMMLEVAVLSSSYSVYPTVVSPTSAFWGWHSLSSPSSKIAVLPALFCWAWPTVYSHCWHWCISRILFWRLSSDSYGKLSPCASTVSSPDSLCYAFSLFNPEAAAFLLQC